MTYYQKTWEIAGVYSFNMGNLIISNPKMKVTSVTFLNDNIVSISLSIKENDGVFDHYYVFQYENNTGDYNVNSVVDSAIANRFPEAVEV